MFTGSLQNYYDIRESTGFKNVSLAVSRVIFFQIFMLVLSESVHQNILAAKPPSKALADHIFRHVTYLFVKAKKCPSFIPMTLICTTPGIRGPLKCRLPITNYSATAPANCSRRMQTGRKTLTPRFAQALWMKNDADQDSIQVINPLTGKPM